MNYSLPAVEEYERLIPVARTLYEHTSSLSWEMLLPLFLVSVAIGYTTDLGIAGAVLLRLKKLVLCALLLISFPMIAEFSQTLGVEVARSVDDMTGIDMVLEAAAKKAETYSFSVQGLLTIGSDIVMSVLVSVSFIILVVARFFLLAFQHFYWLLLVALGPFLILGILFDSSSGITKGLFKSMFQVASWPVIWSVLSAFLKALPFASAYNSGEGFITIITLNLIIAVALLFSPFIVSQLCEGVNLGIGDTLRRGALRAVAMTNPKGMALSAAAKSMNSANRVQSNVAAQRAAAAAKQRMMRL